MARGDEAWSLRELIAQLIEAGKAYARAEIAYIKQIATARVTAAAMGIGFAIVALVLVQASLTILLAALGMLLARWIGTAGGLAIAALTGLVIAGLLAWIGLQRIKASGGGK